MSRYTYVTQEVKEVEDCKTDSQKMKDLFEKSLIKFYFIVIKSSSKAESILNQTILDSLVFLIQHCFDLSLILLYYCFG